MNKGVDASFFRTQPSCCTPSLLLYSIRQSSQEPTHIEGELASGSWWRVGSKSMLWNNGRHTLVWVLALENTICHPPSSKYIQNVTALSSHIAFPLAPGIMLSHLYYSEWYWWLSLTCIMGDMADPGYADIDGDHNRSSVS